MVMVDRSPATCRNSDKVNDDNCGHSENRLCQNGEKQQVKTTETRVYLGAYAFVVCEKITNEELHYNAFLFEYSNYFSYV